MPEHDGPENILSQVVNIRHLKWSILLHNYRGADKSLARPGRKKATTTEDFDFHVSYLQS